MLREAVDAARGLTETRLGTIATVDEAGATDGFVESGFTPAEPAELAVWPDRERLFEHLRGLSGTLRVADLAIYVQDLGPTATLTLSRSFQGTPDPLFANRTPDSLFANRTAMPRRGIAW